MAFAGDYSPGATFARSSFSNTNFYTTSIYTDYTLDLNKHNLKFMAGMNTEENKYRDLSAQRDNVITPSIPEISASVGEDKIPGRFEDDGGVGQGKDAGPGTNEALGPHDDPERGIHVEESGTQQAQPAEHRPGGADEALVITVAKTGGQRTGQGLHGGLQGQHQTGLLHAEAPPHLQVEAEEKDHAEKGAVVDEGRHQRQAEDPVPAQQAHVHHGEGTAQLPPDETGQQHETEQKEPAAQHELQILAFKRFTLRAE